MLFNNSLNDSPEAIDVTDFQGLEDVFSSAENQSLIVNFWASWCKPCVDELPLFEEINSLKKDDLKVLLVSLDFPSQIETRLIPFIKEHNIQSEIIILDDPDSNSWIDKVDPSWSGALPATLIIDGDSRYFYEGSFEGEGLKQSIEKALGRTIF